MAEETKTPETPQTTTSPAAPSPAPAQAADPQAVANALMAALESRTKRVEPGVVKSMAEQYGMSDEEVGKILAAEKAKRAAELPPEQQKLVKERLERANGLLIAAEVRTLGAPMGLLDADAALALMDKDKVKVDEKGAVAGAKEALEALKESKPYLFGAQGAWGQRQGGNPVPASGVEEAFAKLNPNLKIN